MRRVLTKRWIRRAPSRALLGELARRAREDVHVKPDHFLEALQRRDGRECARFLAGTASVPEASVTHYLDLGEVPPPELLARAGLSDDVFNRALAVAGFEELAALARNEVLGSAQLVLVHEAAAQLDNVSRVQVEFSLVRHPALSAEVVRSMLKTSPEELLVLNLRWRAAQHEPNPTWAEPLTQLWRGSSTHPSTRSMLVRASPAPSSSMSPWYLKDCHPDFLVKTCLEAGLDPEVALVLADGWSGSTEDFLDACTELGPDGPPGSSW